MRRNLASERSFCKGAYKSHDGRSRNSQRHCRGGVMIASKKASGARRRALWLQVAAVVSSVVLSRGGLAQNATESSDAAPAEPETLDQVIVTGTMIHGARPTDQSS